MKFRRATVNVTIFKGRIHSEYSASYLYTPTALFFVPSNRNEPTKCVKQNVHGAVPKLAGWLLVLGCGGCSRLPQSITL